jgi:hypothetical protein
MIFFKFLNGFWAEIELGPCAQYALGLLQLGHSAEMLGPAHAVRGLPGADRRPARVAHKPARPTQAQRPLGVLERM